MSLSGFLLVVFNDIFDLGIDPETYTVAAGFLISFIAAEGVRDAVLAYRTAK